MVLVKPNRSNLFNSILCKGWRKFVEIKQFGKSAYISPAKVVESIVQNGFGSRSISISTDVERLVVARKPRGIWKHFGRRNYPQKLPKILLLTPPPSLDTRHHFPRRSQSFVYILLGVSHRSKPSFKLRRS